NQELSVLITPPESSDGIMSVLMSDLTQS
ncbi:hypothetical protein EVA_15319, partial [gut metagenome]